MSGVITYMGTSIDNALSTFVTSVSTSVAAGITPLVVTALTIWIMVYGFAVMRHEVSEPINVFIWKFLKISVILGVALGSGVYQGHAIASLKALESGLIKTVAPNAGTSIFQVLDDFDAKSAQLALGIIERGVSLLPLGGWLDMATGLIVFTGNAVLLLVCAGFAVMAKVATAFVLGLGPVFIACLAFQPTTKFFDAWLGKVLNYLLLSVILAFGLTLAMKLCDYYLARAIASMNAGSTNQIADAFGMVILYGGLLIMIYQSPHLASGLTGGASLTGGGLGNLAQSAVVGAIARGQPGGSKGNPGSGGGSIAPGQPGRSPQGPAGPNPPSSQPVPAYRRATLNNLSNRRK